MYLPILSFSADVHLTVRLDHGARAWQKGAEASRSVYQVNIDTFIMRVLVFLRLADPWASHSWSGLKPASNTREWVSLPLDNCVSNR